MRRSLTCLLFFKSLREKNSRVILTSYLKTISVKPLCHKFLKLNNSTKKIKKNGVNLCDM